MEVEQGSCTCNIRRHYDLLDNRKYKFQIYDVVIS